MHVIYAALLAAVVGNTPVVGDRAPSAYAVPRAIHANSSVCAPQSICGWIRLGRTDMEATQVHDCVNVYESQGRNTPGGIGNPNLDFSIVLVGIPGSGNTFNIWGRWTNPTSTPQALGSGQLFVTCQSG